MDPWAAVGILAARQAGRATADILRARNAVAYWTGMEIQAGERELLGGAKARLWLSIVELRRECWRELARQPAKVLLPPVALAVMRAAWRSQRT